MYIEIRRDGMSVYEGDAEDFLADNDYDEDIQNFLINLDNEKVGTTKIYFGNFCEEIEIEKLDSMLYNLVY